MSIQMHLQMSQVALEKEYESTERQEKSRGDVTRLHDTHNRAHTHIHV